MHSQLGRTIEISYKLWDSTDYLEGMNNQISLQMSFFDINAYTEFNDM